MSEEEESISNQEQEQENEEQNDEQEQQQEQEQEQEDEQENEDDEQGQDDEQEADEDQQSEREEEEDQENSKRQKQVPTFKPLSQQFAFKNLLAEIASLGNSVDHFINTLPSRGGSAYRSYQPRIQNNLNTKIISSFPPMQQKKYTIMKDEDVQVSMQPQIVIQQTLPPRQEPKKQSYRISNESTKFLAQLYEQNKKLKRWQNNQTGSNGGNWYKSKEKFERPQHERGLINLDDRNKQIDQAIEMLRREDNNNQY